MPGLFPSLRGYRAGDVGPDLLAALTLLVIAVPEQLATSRLAGMPPITGLTTFVAGTVLFALVGSNPWLSVGADSTIAPLFAAGVSRLAGGDTARYTALVCLVAVVTGALLVVVGLARLGWVADFLSAPIVTGFLGGVAIIIVVHQLPDLLGLPAGTGSTLARLSHLARSLGSVNGWSVGIGLGVLAVVVGTEAVDRRLPGAAVALVSSVVLVRAAGLHRHGVATLGSVAHGVPHVGLRDLSWSSLGDVIPLAAVVALVCLSQTAATTRAFPEPGGRSDVDRDFVGVGAGGIVAGLFGGFATDASPPRTAAVVASGGRSQLAGLAAAAAVVASWPAAALLDALPLATLAGVLLWIAGRLFHGRDLAAIARFDRWEFGLALVTMLSVALVGVEQGIAVAVGLAILDRTRLSARPRSYVLGRVPGTTSWAPLTHHEHPQPVPGVVVVLFAAPLYFANARHFRATVLAALDAAPGTRLLVLDAAGMTDIDFTGTQTLHQLLDELERRRITVAVARAEGAVPRNLARSGLLERIGRDHLRNTVDGAVRMFGPPVPAVLPTLPPEGPSTGPPEGPSTGPPKGPSTGPPEGSPAAS